MEPDFQHYPASVLPDVDIDSVDVRVIIGEAFGKQSPVTSYSATLYLECRLPGGSTLALPDTYQESATYVVTGKIRIDGEDYPGGVLAVAAAGETVRLEAVDDSRVMVIGGDRLGERLIWWNFVSHSRERVDKAKLDWKDGRFGKVPGDDEFIPLPEK
jgi:hypothetical protein